MFERLKSLFGNKHDEPERDERDPRDEAELPAGPLTGITSPLDVGGEPATAEPVDDGHS